jgi:hypothetical protein
MINIPIVCHLTAQDKKAQLVYSYIGFPSTIHCCSYQWQMMNSTIQCIHTIQNKRQSVVPNCQYSTLVAL